MRRDKEHPETDLGLPVCPTLTCKLWSAENIHGSLFSVHLMSGGQLEYLWISKHSWLSECFRATWEDGESDININNELKKPMSRKDCKKASHIFNLPDFSFGWPRVVENYHGTHIVSNWMLYQISSQCSPQHTTTVDPPTDEARLCRDYTASAFLRPRNWLELSNQINHWQSARRWRMIVIWPLRIRKDKTDGNRDIDDTKWPACC